MLQNKKELKRILESSVLTKYIFIFLFFCFPYTELKNSFSKEKMQINIGKYKSIQKIYKHFFITISCYLT